ncbi:MAG: hypothetical protein ACRD4Y_03240 [Candidatus Acidiferrales bacterium]
MPLTQTCHSSGCRAEVPDGFRERSLCVEHYLEFANVRLENAAEDFRSGQGVDADTMDWLLGQVDFVVETIGNENVALSEAQRSQLLQLLLGVANLNEYIRHETAVLHEAR